MKMVSYLLLFLLSFQAAALSPASNAHKRATFISSGLYAGYDATDISTFTLNGTRVDEWRPKYGSGLPLGTALADGLTTTNNPVRTAALYNNQGGVAFANKYLATQSAVSALSWATGFTIMAVVNKTGRSGFWMVNDDTTNQAPLSFYMGERFGIGTDSGSRYGAPRNLAYVHGMKWSGTANGSTYRYSLNDKVFAKDLENNSSGTTTFGRIHVGGIIGGQGFATFNIAALFIWDRALSDSEMVQMSNWLRRNYGIAELTPKSWNIVVDGNSIALGYNSSNTSTNSQAIHDGILAANGSPTSRDYVNVSKSAQTTAQLSARAAATVDVLYDTSVLDIKRIVIISEGTNHINAGATDVTAYNETKSYCQARKAVGWKTIVSTILPRTGSANASFETYRLSYNQMIRDAKTNGEAWIDAVADIGGDATYGIQAAASNTSFYNDGIHPRDVVHSALKTYFTNAINAVTGL